MVDKAKLRFMKLSNIPSNGGDPAPPSTTQSAFAAFSKFIDLSGNLNFAGKAILSADGVNFTNGSTYKIKRTDSEIIEQVGKGQYGLVQKVMHIPTRVVMAMKEIRLELTTTKLNQILMELDVLHRSASPFIVDFYGAFYVDQVVFYCMQYMDAGSIDTLYTGGIPEDVLAFITSCMVKGLQFLKDELSVIHRDVKPTNVLANFRGEIKLCDFGVSGQLVQSLAKTNIGCQSYMAPERISVKEAGAYSSSSDVWSLGLSIVEMSFGSYPFPVDKYDSVFAQLNAIVDGETPKLDSEKYSESCRNFVNLSLNKDPKKRPSYAQLLLHPYLVENKFRAVDMISWVALAVANKPVAKERMTLAALQKISI